MLWLLLRLGALLVHVPVTELVWARDNNPCQKWFYEIDKSKNHAQYRISIVIMTLLSGNAADI